MPRIGAGLSTAAAARSAGREAAVRAAAELGGAPADLAFVFLSPGHLDDAEQAIAAVHEELAPARLLGCVAEGVVGPGREVEEGPAASVWAASLPGAEIEPFHAVAVEADGGIAVGGFPDLGGAALVCLVADPFGFPVSPLLELLNEQASGVPLVGGIAGGGSAPGRQALVLDDEVFDEGAIGAVLRGVDVVTLVSQGCAPIGHDLVVTSAEENVVYELAGQPAVARLREEIAGLPPAEQVLAARGLLAGLVIDENKPEYGRGDYLMRGLLGADEASGALAIGSPVRVGQTLRFHVRDAASADGDLRESLAVASAAGRAAGALLFTCNGRGVGMFGEPDHDVRAVGEAFGAPVAGFFCGGEIGPVGGRAFLHGFTATLAVFLDGG